MLTGLSTQKSYKPISLEICYIGEILFKLSALHGQILFPCFSSGKTEFQRVSMNRARRSVKFERRPSQRYSRRPQFEGQDSEKERKASLEVEAAANT